MVYVLKRNTLEKEIFGFESMIILRAAFQLKYEIKLPGSFKRTCQSLSFFFFFFFFFEILEGAKMLLAKNVLPGCSETQWTKNQLQHHHAEISITTTTTTTATTI